MLATLDRGLAQVTGAVDRVVAAVTILLLGFIVCANGIEILQRGLFNRSFQWLYEINLLTSIWMYFMGMSMVYYRNRDITLDFILLVVKGAPRRLYLVAVNLVAIAAFAVTAYFGMALMRLQMPFRTSGFGIPNPLFTLPVVLGCVSIALILASQSLAIWRGADPGTSGHVVVAE